MTFVYTSVSFSPSSPLRYLRASVFISVYIWDLTSKKEYYRQNHSFSLLLSLIRDFLNLVLSLILSISPQQTLKLSFTLPPSQTTRPNTRTNIRTLSNLHRSKKIKPPSSSSRRYESNHTYFRTFQAYRKLLEVLRRLGVVRWKFLDVRTRRSTSSKFGRSFRGFFRRIPNDLGVKKFRQNPTAGETSPATQGRRRRACMGQAVGGM
ncbi:uncharacterized protein LOC126633882 [Malus sylvestris]|uniref:uncharacterized protein LOC126633882 n=1 Tax=Malus sylvestris TaxID=3752 RepID=UPI0021AD3D9E|nr:uncharacterized protein LOC126633882 [Malus sylvestris]